MSEEKKPTVSYRLELSAQEAVLLDGKVNGKAQSEIDKARFALSLEGSNNLTDKQRKLIAEIVATAKETGRLTRVARSATSCPSCGKRPGYHPYSRNGRLHRKGQPNYDSPILFTVYDYDRGCVGIQNTVFQGCCDECKDIFESELRTVLAGIQADLPPELRTGPKLKRYDNRRCKCCGWEGHEGQLKPVPAVMGGHYPGQCPNCGEKNLFLGPRNIETTKGFTLVEIEPATKEGGAA